MHRVATKIAMVTGAASGLGESIAMLLAQEGAKVLVADIAESEGRQVVDAIRNMGGDAHYIHLDVSQESDWKAAMKEALAIYGGLHVMVNNAGIAPQVRWKWILRYGAR